MNVSYFELWIISLLQKKSTSLCNNISHYFRCYTVHVVKSLNYFTNHCTYINL